ncbi:hypothetical protein SS50377_20201 [Spironucleus salmonicida]|nr:hypothetical protein SS50377_20201 [Spironucleus salmonicida]
MTDIQNAFTAFKPIESSIKTEFTANKKQQPKRLPIKQYLESIKEQHTEWAPNQMMFQNVHPDTTKQEIATQIQQKLNISAIVYERGNLAYDKKERVRKFNSYGHKLIFAKFEQEVTDEMIHSMRGMTIQGRDIYVRRQDKNLDETKTCFIRGVKGHMNLQNIFDKVNGQIKKFEKDNFIADVKMIYQDRKLKGFIYVEFNTRLQRENGDRLFMKTLKVDNEIIQLKKYISKKKQAKQSKKFIKDSNNHQGKNKNNKIEAKSTLAQNMMKKHNRK